MRIKDRIEWGPKLEEYSYFDIKDVTRAAVMSLVDPVILKEGENFIEFEHWLDDEVAQTRPKESA